MCTTTAVFVRDGSSDGGLLTRPTSSNVSKIKIIMRHSLIFVIPIVIFLQRHTPNYKEQKKKTDKGKLVKRTMVGDTFRC